MAGLTARETEVLALLALGWSNAEIADRLGISGRTVEQYQRRGMDAIGATTRADIVPWAIKTDRFHVDPDGLAASGE